MNANHEDWKQLVSAYIDDELTPEERDTVNDHLVDCPACQKYLKELQVLSRNIKSLNNQSLSPDLEQRLNNLNSRTERPDMNRSTVWKFVKTLTPVVLIVFVAIFSLQNYAQRSIQARIKDASNYMDGQTTLALGGRLHSAADDIGAQYSSGNTNVYRRVDQLALARKSEKKTEAIYEPYYAATDYKVERASTDAILQSPAAVAPASSSKTKGDKQITWRDTATTASARQNVIALGKDGQEREQRGVAIVGGYTSVDYEVNQPQNGAVGAGMIVAPEKEYNYQLPPQYPYTTVQIQESNTEQYDLINENEFAEVTENPLSTFSIDVDTASYSNVRRFINDNQLPPRDAVRVEEMINYFKYNYSQPGWNQPFSINLEHGVCPWNTAHQLVLVGLQGKQLTERQTPPSNLVFLIDVSGSMNDANKLPLLQQSLKMMVSQLRPEERISMVVYAGNAGVVLDSTPGYNKGLIMSAIDNLRAGGSTAGGQGIQLAYDIARKNFIRNGNNRVILATDGDFNVGVSSDSELVQLIEEQRKSGIFLTVLGFGTGNLQDGKMEKLADKGNGNYFYIDSIDEGKKVLVDELGSTIIAIAKDVKVQIEFNPKAVKAYRLIGYENRKLAKEDFNDDTKDAGELGAGHTVTALYEIVPAGSWESTTGNVDPLKYQKHTTQKPIFGSDKEMMTVKLRYKEPKSETSQLITKVLTAPSKTFGQMWSAGGASDNLQFASAVAEFGMLLRGSKYTANSSYNAVIQRAQNSAYNDPDGHKNEFIGLVQKASSLDTRHRPQVPVYQSTQPIYPVYDQQGGYQQK